MPVPSSGKRIGHSRQKLNNVPITSLELERERERESHHTLAKSKFLVPLSITDTVDSKFSYDFISDVARQNAIASKKVFICTLDGAICASLKYNAEGNIISGLCSFIHSTLWADNPRVGTPHCPLAHWNRNDGLSWKRGVKFILPEFSYSRDDRIFQITKHFEKYSDQSTIVKWIEDGWVGTPTVSR